jgi:hypothetical protein
MQALPLSFSGETLAQKCAGIVEGAMANGLVRRDEMVRRASAISREGMAKQTI